MLDSNLTSHQRQELDGILASGLQCSEHHLVQGSRASYYINLDQVLQDPVRAKRLSVLVVRALRRYIDDMDITKLVFVDAGELGARGMLQMRTHLGVELDVATVLCQTSKRIARSRIVGELGPSDRLVIVTDVITSGSKVAEACAICRSLGATVCAVFSLFDRQEVDEEQLKRVGIQKCISATEFTSFQRNFADGIEGQNYRQIIQSHKPAIEHRDLVGDAVEKIYS